MAAEHKHLIIRAEVNRPPVNAAWTTRWLIQLVDKIGMKILMGPYAKYCPVVGNAGLTAAVLIETSHIVLHVWDEEPIGELQLDLYTCSSLDPQLIFDELQQFEPFKIEFKYLDRDKGLTEIHPKDINI